jgi:hypothetical protein
MIGGGLVGWVTLLAYYFEQVEGVRTLRPLLGGLLVLAFWGRAFLLARVARRLVEPLLPRGAALEPMRFPDVARTASVVGIGLWCWLWLLVIGSYVSSFTVAALLLPLAFRGAVAPTWIARAGCERDAGLAAFRRSAQDLGDDRLLGFGVELFVLLGGLTIFVNLLAALGFVSLLGRSFLGFDVASAETFLSPRNDFVLLVMAIVTAIVLEPLRAAVSAVLYIDARARREGFDLEAAIAGLGQLGRRAALVLGVVATLGFTGSARADDGALGSAPPEAPAFSEPPEAPAWSEPRAEEPAAVEAPVEPDVELTPRDLDVSDAVFQVLVRPEFRELSGTPRGRTLEELIERFFDWLFEGRDLSLPEAEERTPLPMPPSWVFVALAVAFLAVVLFVFLRNVEVEALTSAGDTRTSAMPDPRDRSPESHLDEAARLAAEGAYREAFRALYLATLVALDRRGAIAFDRSRTNWHYLRSMRPGATREDFHRFTALFDRKWYGDEATDDGDYRLGRELADRVCAGDVEEAS